MNNNNNNKRSIVTSTVSHILEDNKISTQMTKKAKNKSMKLLGATLRLSNALHSQYETVAFPYHSHTSATSFARNLAVRDILRIIRG